MFFPANVLRYTVYRPTLTFLCHIRILSLYAEENAIDDATYFLGEALRREAITLDVFLKVIIPRVCTYQLFYI